MLDAEIQVLEVLAAMEEIGEEQRQLAEWLKELKQLREQTRWIPVSERLPEESGYYLTSVLINGGYFSEVCVRWFAHPDDYSITTGEWRDCTDDELVIAWMPSLLPKPYEAESEE